METLNNDTKYDYNETDYSNVCQLMQSLFNISQEWM